MSTRDDVLELLQRSDGPLAPREVATRLALNYDRVKKCMQRLARAGELVTDGTGTYAVPERDIATEPRDKGPLVRVLRDAWEDPPSSPRFVERWFRGH